jgi:hypothetical protein
MISSPHIQLLLYIWAALWLLLLSLYAVLFTWYAYPTLQRAWGSALEWPVRNAARRAMRQQHTRASRHTPQPQPAAQSGLPFSQGTPDTLRTSWPDARHGSNTQEELHP